MIVGELPVVGKRIGGSHDAVISLRVGLLSLDVVTHLASANELSFIRLR
jgi:hypothetical protein